MGALELRSRLAGFEPHVSNGDWRFNAYERSDGFEDVIQPDALNIIDFLEMGTDFWKVGEKIMAIWKRLRNGVAVILIQKSRDSDFARGGEFSIEKARLYLTLDKGNPYNFAKIVSAKNWVNPQVNPNGYGLQYRLARGCLMHPAEAQPDWTWMDIPDPDHRRKEYRSSKYPHVT